MKITFRQIDAFRTVVSTGTVTETARILGVSQPAVSRLISDLEAEVGFKLFTRSGRNLVPTLEARLLVDEVRAALSGLERIKQAADAIGRFRHARLSLVTTPTFSTSLAAQLIRAFSARHPEAMVSLEIQPNDDTVEWMISQTFDFGIVPPREINASFETIDLIDAQSICVVPRDHALASRGTVTPRDLSGESFISYLPDSQFRHQVDAVFDADDIARNMRFEARTSDAICALVGAGLGVAVIGSDRNALQVPETCVTLAFAPAIPFKAVLAWTRQRPFSAVAEAFLQVAREHLGTVDHEL